ncbi:FAD/NAD(P)-binding domain-containing protein [Teratosphaeria destructans]|uniref:FAD/NAD(P)-binding domain-containing protein n=1 Tax=Teratosphaeria destructans TaxID=418781 RepID=A0A9W7SQ95_9PEZI|nr:FAD/NAD(P)-binding domain-containing protein [Teratosphaeria destructans]
MRIGLLNPSTVPLAVGILRDWIYKSPALERTHDSNCWIRMDDYLRNVAIIGAGLGGCALALALSNNDIPVTLYEARPSTSEGLVSGVILTPNGLRILDQLGVFSRIKERCYVSTDRCFKNDRDETTKKTPTASLEKFGYNNHRLWRSILLDEMKQMLAEQKIRINYSSKFIGVVSEDSTGVTFRINSKTHSASLLIGSDGIHSTLRKYMAPDVEPEYTGIVGILAHIKRDAVAWPYEDYERNATIQGKPGALFFLPEDPKGIDIMVGMQVQYPQQSREDLNRLQADKDRLVSMYRLGYDEWGPTARSIIDQVTLNKENIYTWPYLRMPKLERWYTDTGRIIMVGDGAHALPPSSGQGVNQAIEDAFSLKSLFTSIRESPKNSADGDATRARVLDALAFWQTMRQKRIDQICDWATSATNVQRLPEAERRKREAEGKTAHAYEDMSWLYNSHLQEEIQAWTVVKLVEPFLGVRPPPTLNRDQTFTSIDRANVAKDEPRGLRARELTSKVLCPERAHGDFHAYAVSWAQLRRQHPLGWPCSLSPSLGRDLQGKQRFTIYVPCDEDDAAIISYPRFSEAAVTSDGEWRVLGGRVDAQFTIAGCSWGEVSEYGSGFIRLGKRSSAGSDA